MTNERSKRPPIEPLGDAAWSRVERQVWAELDAVAPPVSTRVTPRRGRRIARWVAIAALPTAAAAAVVTWVAPHGDGRRSPTTTAPTGTGSAAPQWVVSGDSATQVAFGDASITVAPHSAIVMSGTPEAGLLVIADRGGARFAVDGRAETPRFVVQAGAITVRVVSAEFGVERVGDVARVEVFRGTLEVFGPGERATVDAGQTWPAAAATTPATPTPPAPTPPATSDDHAAAADHPADHAGVEHSGRDGDRGHAHVATASPPPLLAPPAPLDPAQRFAAAAALEATDPAAALSGYAGLAADHGPWAANALYAAARLHYDRHELAAARAASEQYLRRFPRGPNAADARALIDRLQGASP